MTIMITKEIETFLLQHTDFKMYTTFSLKVHRLLGYDTEYTSILQPVACIIRVDDDDVSRFLQNVGTYLPHYMMSHPEDNNLHSHLQKNLEFQQFHFLWHVIETFVSSYYGCAIVCVYTFISSIYSFFLVLCILYFLIPIQEQPQFN